MKGFCLKITKNKEITILPNFYSEKGYNTKQLEYIRSSKAIKLVNDPRNKGKTIFVSWVKAEKKDGKVTILET